jgi:CBS-domain-containing membrane protein
LRAPVNSLYIDNTANEDDLLDTLKLSASQEGSFSNKTKKQTPWSESAIELYRPSYCRLSAKLLPTLADRGCHVVSVTDPSGRILGI